MKIKFWHILLLIVVVASCNRDKPTNKPNAETEVTETEVTEKDTAESEILIDENIVVDEDKPDPEPTKSEGKTYDETLWHELVASDGFALDIKYATKNNFTKKQIYDCGKCFMRPEAATKLKVINEELKQKFGYSLKLFDCYRPGPYQQRLWDIVPDPDYVTPPHKGSMHSKGLAIDLTLIDKDGNELDMGTEFDFFGPEAHQGYDHSEAVKRHRWILKSTMEKHGFGSIRTEWWHFSYRSKSYPLDNWVWACK